MKTLHVETGRHLYGGAQQVLYLTEGLTGRGVDTLLVCTPDSAIAEAAASQGVAVETIPCSGDLDLRFLSRLKTLLKRLTPDIVHCHSRRGADFLGGQAAAMAGIPAVVSRRVDNPEPAMLAQLRYRRFARIIAISEAIRDVLLASGIPADRIEVIRSGVDVDRFAEAPGREILMDTFGVPADATVILSAAQLIPRKGQGYLLEALARLKPAYPKLRAVICGQGPEEVGLKRQAGQLGIDDIVLFAGFRDDLDDMLGAFDLLVHTASAEGLGVIALKAQAAGVPVIAFEAGGLPEVVKHAATGLLVPDADVSALAAAIAGLLDDTATRDRYASAARENAQDNLSTAPMIEAHLKLYASLLNC